MKRDNCVQNDVYYCIYRSFAYSNISPKFSIVNIFKRQKIRDFLENNFYFDNSLNHRLVIKESYVL